MGFDNVTVQNLEVMKVDKDSSLIAVKGAIPGHKNSFVIVRESKKMPKGFVKHKPVVAHVKKKSAKAAVAAAAKK
jgi:large subunit ribosomal protein L3